MNTKILLSFFAILTVTMILSITFMVVVAFDVIDKPTRVYYTVNTYNYTNTYETINNIPNKQRDVKATKRHKQTAKYSDSDIHLLAQLINAEAKGESFNGKVAVGDVIMNRVRSSKFPNTIRGVIYQPRQFQPVSNGKINNEPNKDSISAAKVSLSKNLIGNALYFYNPHIATDSWIRTRNVVLKIGNHVFAL